ncbi:MAG: peptidyl-prolyl cis-trans isomerase A (cyclophilin A) [Cognaticolwellia sp.]|jgi:peptidyl-prolyl cis-trans isomerase A (cyclophilin A)
MKMFIGVPLFSILFTLTACGPGTAHEQELQDAESKLNTTQDELDRTRRENDALKARVDSLVEEVAAQRLAATLGQLGIEPGEPLSATIKTSMGDFHCELFPQDAPKTVLNFVQLAEGSRTWTHPRTGQQVDGPLYDGTIFHRVIPGFMVQAGDPLGTGTGGPGYKFEDEFSDRAFDKPGVLAMANAGANTNGSQFFITEVPTPHLTGKHSIFGQCEEVPLVKEITSVDRLPGDKPATDIVLKKIVIERG